MSSPTATAQTALKIGRVSQSQPQKDNPNKSLLTTALHFFYRNRLYSGLLTPLKQSCSLNEDMRVQKSDYTLFLSLPSPFYIDQTYPHSWLSPLAAPINEATYLS